MGKSENDVGLKNETRFETSFWSAIHKVLYGSYIEVEWD